MKVRAQLLLTLAATALALAACGSSTPSHTSSTASTSTATSTDSAAGSSATTTSADSAAASSAAASGKADADANAAAAASAEAASTSAPADTTSSDAYPEPRKTATRKLVEQVRQPADAPTRRAVAALVLRYMHAIAHRDYRTACATRTPAEQRALARAGHSCPAMLRRAYRRTDETVFDRVRVTAVRRRGDVAVALIALGKITAPADDALVAQHIGGHWRLVDLEG
jgi:hypothetical protein